GSGPNRNFEVDYAISTTSQTNVEYACSDTDESGIVLDAVSSGNGLQTHAPILISGNDGFTTDNGAPSGTGTSDNPYVISGWTISAENYGIQISGTTAYFTITNVAISCDPTNADCWGIMFSSVENGVVQNSHLSGPRGIGVHNSDNFQVTENNLSPGEDGIVLSNFSGLLISQNSIVGHVSIGVQNCGDSTIDGNTANAHDYGIFVSACGNVLVSNNNASNITNGQGIYLDNSDNVTITSNTLSNN